MPTKSSQKRVHFEFRPKIVIWFTYIYISGSWLKSWISGFRNANNGDSISLEKSWTEHFWSGQIFLCFMFGKERQEKKKKHCSILRTNKFGEWKLHSLRECLRRCFHVWLFHRFCEEKVSDFPWEIEFNKDLRDKSSIIIFAACKKSARTSEIYQIPDWHFCRWTASVIVPLNSNHCERLLPQVLGALTVKPLFW